MSRTIRTVFRPDVETTVSEDEYASLFRRGLIYDDVNPPDGPADPLDLAVAGHVRDAESETTAALRAAFVPANNLSTFGIYLPEQFGAVGDGVADDTAAVQAAINACNAAITAQPRASMAIGKVWLSRKIYVCIGLTNPGQVMIEGNGAVLQATGTSGNPILSFSGKHGGVRDVMFLGRGLGGVIASGVTFASGARWNKVENCRWDQFTGRAVYFAPGSVANELTSALLIQGCLLDTASLSTYTGAVEVDGTDHYIHNCEISVSRSTRSSDNLYADALVLRGSNHMVSNTVAETSDIGVVCTATDIKIVNTRADLNRGHGWLFLSGSGSVVGCGSLNNSQDTDLGYDGFKYLAGDFSHSACYARVTSVNRHNFGFNDQQNSLASANAFDASCRSTGQGAAAFFGPGFAPGRVGQASNAPYNLPANFTTTSAQGPGWPLKNVQFVNTTPVSFTDFTRGLAGQELLVWGDGFTTLVHGPQIQLLGGTNKLLADKSTTRLVRNSLVWYEVA